MKFDANWNEFVFEISYTFTSTIRLGWTIFDINKNFILENKTLSPSMTCNLTQYEKCINATKTY